MMARRSKAALFVAISLVALLALLVTSDWRGFERPRPLADRAKCAENMHQIGLAIEMYTDGNPQGQFPENLQILMTTQQLPPELFVCCSTDDTAAPGKSVEESANNLTLGGHLSYIYIGAGLTKNSPADVVVLYEPLTNHDNTGGNVLFADAHAEFLQPPAVAQIAAMAQSGMRPIYWPPHPATGPSAGPGE